MIVENAQVIAVDGSHAIVQTQRSSVCGSCAVNNGCGTAILNRVLLRKYCTLKVMNPVSANIGDRVQIGIAESSLVKSALLLYVLPLLSVLLAILLATIIFGSELTDLTAIVFSVSGFIVGLSFVSVVSKRLGKKPEFQTRILSVDSSDDLVSPVLSRSN